MDVVLCTSPHLNHAAFQEGVVPLAGPTDSVAQRFVPMGLLSLAGAAPTSVDVGIKDINKAINELVVPLGPNFYLHCADWLVEGGPSLIGFMTEVDSYHHVLRMCKAIKAQHPSVRTLLGGPHASAVHRETLAHCEFVDFVIRGEGEVAFAQLLTKLDGAVENVGNLSYRRQGEIKVSRDLPLIEVLDDLPWPDYERIDLRSDDDIYVEIGRGCPFRCNFCFTAPYWQRKHRIKSAERIIRELQHLKRAYGRIDANFTHDLFTVNRQWVLNFCRQLHAADLGITWTCSSRTDTLDEEQIEWMARAGCRNIYFGVETGTPEMQERIQKNLDLAEARQIIGLTASAGIGVTVGFIAGLPGESDQTLSGTIKEAVHFLSLRDSTVHLFGYNPYRGSAVFEEVKATLMFDPNFVDFPLGYSAARQNREMMATWPYLFTRYSRPEWERGLQLRTIQAAEGFFPILNAVRDLTLHLSRHGVDFYHLLEAWADWIMRAHSGLAVGGQPTHRGTIGDFLTFLVDYLTDVGLADEMLLERISWEKHKNRLRGRTTARANDVHQGRASGRGGLGLADTAARSMSTEAVIHTNPSLVQAAFRYAPRFDGRTSGTVVYAFYRRADGSPGIVRLSALAGLILELSTEGANPSMLVAAVTRMAPPGTNVQAAELMALIAHLQEADLVLRRSNRTRRRPSGQRPATTVH